MAEKEEQEQIERKKLLTAIEETNAREEKKERDRPKSNSSCSSSNSSADGDGTFKIPDGPPSMEMRMTLMSEFTTPKEEEEVVINLEIKRKQTIFQDEEAKKEKIRKEEAEKERLQIEELQNEKAKAEKAIGNKMEPVPIQSSEPSSSSNVLVISQNDQFVGGEKNLYFDPNGEMIDS